MRGVLAALCFVPLLWHSRAQLPKQPRAFWAAAGELAVWNFLSQGLLNVALLYTDATRVSFLAQTAIVLTPVFAACSGQSVAAGIWAACAAALAGVALLASDGGAAVAAAATPAIALSVGDMLALGGAATSSLYIFRIGELGKRGLSSDLTQAVKVALIGGLYCVWAAFDCARVLASGAPLTVMWPGYTSLLAWAVLLYSAVVPGALADVLQARGQKLVTASEAQVILASEPLWTALLGVCLLNERLGRSGWAGGALIVFSVLLASVADGLLKKKPKKA